jgi:hypothetical protein
MAPSAPSFSPSRRAKACVQPRRRIGWRLAYGKLWEIMHLYIAGFFASGTGSFGLGGAGRGGDFASRISPELEAQRQTIDHILESYHYIGKAATVPNQLRALKKKIFLDSGAYTAMTKGAVIDIDLYAKFQKQNLDVIRMASVLDAIGDPNATWQNQSRLEELGCAVIPCFHYGEPFEVGRYYAKNYPYISLGGMVPISSGPLQIWLDEVFTEVICDRSGHAQCKVHGFGMTSLDLMWRYPWFSVDSTSWLMYAMFGNIIFPESRRPLAVSEKSPSRKDLGRHFDSLSRAEQEHIRNLAKKYSLDLELCKSDYVPRYMFNCFAFHEMGKLMGEDHWQKPFQHRQRRLFA